MSMPVSVVAGSPAVAGGLLAMVAGELPGHGVEVRPAGLGSLAVTVPGGAGSVLTVSESASVEWECRVPGGAADAAVILADLAACLLGGGDSDPGPPGGPGAGGLSLTSVELDAYLTQAAGERLGAMGLRPRLVTADATGVLDTRGM